MHEREVLRIIREQVAEAGDDAAVLPFSNTNLVFTTDMLHRNSDFPWGTSPYTIGWRSVAVSLSDLAAMGARPLGVLLAFGDPALDEELVRGVLDGAIACCQRVGIRLMGGDIDRHSELTLVSTGIGEVERPARRRGARVGDLVCVTGELGRTQAALSLFERQEVERANALFSFPPRVSWGERLAPLVTSMIDISDGLAHSLHLLAREGGVGYAIESMNLPVIPELIQSLSPGARSDALLFGGEDYELLFTIPAVAQEQITAEVRYTVIGRVTQGEVLLDDHKLPDRGYEH